MAKTRVGKPISRTFTSQGLGQSIGQGTTLQPKCSISWLKTEHHLEEALASFNAINSTSEEQSYAANLLACARFRRLEDGVAVHHKLLSHIPKPGLFLTNHLINLYCKCGCLARARELFDQMPTRNLVSWTALLSGYNEHNIPDECFRLFKNMIHDHLPNEFSFGSVLSSRTKSCDICGGQQVHSLAIKMSFDAYLHVGNALITMYYRCRASDYNAGDSWLVFQQMDKRNVVTWNSVLSGFALDGHGHCSIELFVKMREEGVIFDRATLVSLLCCCSDMGLSDAAFQSRQLHSLVIKSGFVTDLKVATALMDAYSKLGGVIHDCYRVFSETYQPDIISWTGIITSCADCNPEEALRLFIVLIHENLIPDRHTFSIAVKACASLPTERHASALHAQILKSGYGGELVLMNALIHAYSRCGNLNLSEHLFDEMPERDIISWNSMLKAYAIHGRGLEALQLFSRMDRKPDAVTFAGLLSACSHAGLVDEGREIFNSMDVKHGVSPRCDHYACMVDILGRSGCLKEAESLISRMPVHADSVVWSSLLAASRNHGEIEIGQRAAENLIKLDPGKSIGYVLMANIYCKIGSFSNSRCVRKEMSASGVMKEPGLSWVEVQNRVHEFASGGRRHPQKQEIYREVELLACRLKERGYVPETSLVLLQLEEEQRVEQLLYHSEKLALAFVLLVEGGTELRSRPPIKIMKNIRVCRDCHNFMKGASDFVRREIVLRDAIRFHHFRNGVCSCCDYW